MFALAFSSLNCLCAHNERHMSFILVHLCGTAYMLLMVITTITCVHHTRTSRAVVYKHARFTRVELQNTVYNTAHFKLDNTHVQQLHGSTRFQKCLQHFPRAHDRPMTYNHWKLYACMHETFILLACVA